MKPGDVWVVEIPELGGHEQSGMRPAVIIAKVAKTIVTIIPLTSNKTALRFPFTYPVESTKSNGLSVNSVALVFHIRALDVGFFQKRIGILDKKTMTQIRKQARRLIG